MNPLQRSSLGIELDQVFEGLATCPQLFAGHDLGGRHYLVALVGRDTRAETWLCAPVSPRALQCVAEGRADPVDAIRHSATGTVERVVVATNGSRVLGESLQLCRDLGDELSACGPGRRQPPIARCA